MISSLLKAIGTLGGLIALYNLFIDSVEKHKQYYIDLIESRTIKEKYYQILDRILKYLHEQFGDKFSAKANSLNYNLAVFYSFTVFYLIYIVTGDGKLGNLDVLSSSIPSTFRIFILGVSIAYFGYLYRRFREIRENGFVNLANFERFVIPVITLLPSLIVAYSISYNWNYGVSINEIVKTSSILGLAVTLCSAILAFSGDGKGSESGLGALVFNITYMSMVGSAAVISSFMKLGVLPIWGPVLVSIIFLLLIVVSYIFYRKQISHFYLNLVVVAFTFFIKFLIPDIFGMDVISLSLVYFFVVLPFINGNLDYLSLGVSRYFATKIASREKGIAGISYNLLIDLIVALVLLTVMVVFFVFVTRLFNWVVNEDQYLIRVDKILEIAIEEPRASSSIWVYSMFISTLIPTFLHVFAAITSIAFDLPFEKSRESLLKLLSKDELKIEDKLQIFAFIILSQFGILLLISFIFWRFVIVAGPFLLSWLQDIISFIPTL